VSAGVDVGLAAGTSVGTEVLAARGDEVTAAVGAAFDRQPVNHRHASASSPRIRTVLEPRNRRRLVIIPFLVRQEPAQDHADDGDDDACLYLRFS